MKCGWIVMLALALTAGTGGAHGQVAHKCKNAAGIIEYSDKPCLTTHDSVPWRPKYSGSAERLAKQPERAVETPTPKTAAAQQPRKSAYTRWLDSKEEAEVKK